MKRAWWKDAVFYQIYPRSFADSNGDGIGDLEGIRRHLDHLVDLGVDALWLSPFYPSPMYDFGYDVSDYCGVDPVFGTLEDARRLVAEVHDRGLRIIIDFVPNHSSSEHPWFVDARTSRDARHRDWYIWHDPVGPIGPDGDPGPPPNNWHATFIDAPAWTWEAATGQWYLHQFLPQQPDLNWANPEVEAAMHDVLRFWMDLGVDGFRIDVVHGIGKDPTFPDDPPEMAKYPHLNEHESTHGYMRNMRALADSYAGDRVLVGEVFILSTAKMARYYGDNDELHLSFNFPPLFAPWLAAQWRKRIERTREALDPIDAWPTWVLSNHDNPRHRTRYGSEERARAAALLLLGLRGSPFLYAGEELGLEDAIVPEHRVVDPGGRDGCRAPIPWDDTPAHGWASTDPWLPWPPDPDGHSVTVEAKTEGSFLRLYKSALAYRKQSSALREGDFTWVESADDVLAWDRGDEADRVRVMINFGPAAVPVPQGWTVVVSSSGNTTALDAFAGMWLRPT